MTYRNEYDSPQHCERGKRSQHGYDKNYIPHETRDEKQDHLQTNHRKKESS